MTRRAPPHNTLIRAAGVALLGHGALLALFAVGAARGRVFLLDAWTPLFATEERATPLSNATWVDLRALGPDVVPAPATPLSVVTAVADEARVSPRSTSPERGSGAVLATSAPDSGEGQGRQAVPAFRRDRSTMRARGSDGARLYRVAQERTSSSVSSPQPIRQEPMVGIGDASRTRQPRPTDRIVARPSLPADAAGIDPLEVADPDPAEALRETPGSDHARSQGPLDAEQGRRRFDVERPGPAQDAQWVRAASNESHPGRMELSAPGGAVARGAEGRGPAPMPGAVAHPSTGTAPTVYGASEAQRAAELAASALERESFRLQAEIRRRVSSAMQWPQKLALALEQGETVVTFVVRPDGRLGSAVRIVKSAGFEEFDTAAVSAVTRAAPFPSMGRALSVLMPIAFDNPVVR